MLVEPVDAVDLVESQDSQDMCAKKYPLVSMGGRVEGQVWADPGARTPIGASGNFILSQDYQLLVILIISRFPTDEISSLILSISCESDTIQTQTLPPQMGVPEASTVGNSNYHEIINSL